MTEENCAVQDCNSSKINNSSDISMSKCSFDENQSKWKAI